MSDNGPMYELEAGNNGPDNMELVLWQMPCAATPHLKAPLRVAGLRGRNLALMEASVLKLLKKGGVRLDVKPGWMRKYALDEETALNLGLLCKTLAPMRNPERMRQVATGISLMRQPEAAYWLGMAMHRKNPRRVLSALRVLLTA